MKPILFLLTCLFLCNCTSNDKQEKQHVSGTAASGKIINYDSCKKLILSLKQQQKTKWHGLSKMVKEKVFTDAVTETIVPAWIGTTWNFYGTTEIPRKGSIACGYFVTTVLRDAGLPIARVKLAQCASEQMITSLVQPQYITRLSNASIETFTQSVKKAGTGLYIIGLDNHTGFIYNDGSNIYFIHASYIGTRSVQKDIAITNPIIRNSKYRILGKISSDEKVLERWIN